MTSRGEPPLARLSAVFAIVVAMAACSDTPSAPVPGPAPAPALAPAPAPEPVPAPQPDPLESLPAPVLETRTALLAAAEAGDWDALGALLPNDPADFSSNFGGETDHLAYYRSLEADLFAEVVALLEGPFATAADTTIWPEVHTRAPFAFGADERDALEERYGADLLAQWQAAGMYLGWRIGIDESGAWLFLIAGD